MWHSKIESVRCSLRGPKDSKIINFAISHNVETLSLVTYHALPDFFFRNSCLKKLVVNSRCGNMTPHCNVSWTSLTDLCLSYSTLSDESFSNIVSGSPLLESLTLQSCSFGCLDLSESLRLRRLDIQVASYAPRVVHVVAPHIHYLRLRDFKSKCVLADVSSLMEANVDTIYYLPKFWVKQIELSKDPDDPSNDEYQVMLQMMLEKLQNVESLTVGLSFLQMLSIAEFRGVPLPTLKVKTLILKTTIVRSAVPGIAKLLQISPGLKKIIFHKTEDWNCVVDLVEKHVTRYIDRQDLKDLIFPTRSMFRVAKPDLLASFMELLLANTRTLEMLVVRLGSCLNRSNVAELTQVALTLSHKNKVSIVLK
ncbi:unnamed protein product [Microthlaspi erraticum]|uniref:F-box/LRR-repeat protein 15/At3g58940/PEG3-like LRR domain-containing protein n=1 Tax=Microthlaspi erraticum TaxID=1685480 RepID=A0A6D2J6M0_9BRAS|nr:unnamed protein product [Microthlaspi erraticum]